jgi:hypothetical protein
VNGHYRTAQPQRRRTPDQRAIPLARYVLAAALVIGVLGFGAAIGFGDFLGRPSPGATSALPVRMSMAGFDPAVITARAGELLTLELWTTDAAPHLQGGVHTLISDELSFYEELPAESRRIVTLRMPAAAGDYDIYCDTCCGGKQSPTMHAILRVEA